MPNLSEHFIQAEAERIWAGQGRPIGSHRFDLRADAARPISSASLDRKDVVRLVKGEWEQHVGQS